MLYLHGIGHFHPENVITNRFLEELGIGTDEAWILERVGIRERRTVLSLDYIRQTKNHDPRAAHEASLYRNAETAAAAARMALGRAGLRPGDIGPGHFGVLRPRTTSTPGGGGYGGGGTGDRRPCLDVNSACTTFGMQIDLLNRMAADQTSAFRAHRPAGRDHPRHRFQRPSSAVLFGDGSTAAVLSASVKARAAFVESGCGTNAAAWEKVTIPFACPFPPGRPCRPGVRHPPDDGVPPGPQSRAMADARAVSVSSATRRTWGRSGPSANGRGSRSEQHWHNVVDFGNTGCAGAPAVLSEHWDELSPGDRVAICLVGGRPDVGQPAACRGGICHDLRRVSEAVPASAWRNSSPSPTGPWWKTPGRLRGPPAGAAFPDGGPDPRNPGRTAVRGGSWRNRIFASMPGTSSATCPPTRSSPAASAWTPSGSSSGFFCVWRGALGSGRALGCGEVVFSGQIRPFNRCVRYEIEVRRFTHLKESGASIVIGEGRVFVDGEDDCRDPRGADGRLPGDRLSGLPPPVGERRRRPDG